MRKMRRRVGCRATANRGPRHEMCWYLRVPPGCVLRKRTSQMEGSMNQDIMKGQWKQLKGKAREKWGKLTDDDLDRVQGRREQLVGMIQERYGVARDEAERQVETWSPDSYDRKLDDL